MTDEEEWVITPGGPRPKSSTRKVAQGRAVRRTPEGTHVLVTEAPTDQDDGSEGMADEYVLTPGGLRPKSLVHKVARDNVVDVTDGRLRLMRRSGEVVAELGELPTRPGGRPLMPRNVVPPSVRVAPVAPAPAGVVPAFGSGWITYASWTNGTGTPVSLFSTTWVVPPAPSTQSGQTIFLFNGIQNSTNIYQPVLQWGSSAAGGGNFWSVASWYVDGAGGTAFYSSLVPVNPGDVLTGVMTLTGQSPAGFSYNCDFTGIANTGLSIQNVQELTWLIETLECYGITQCSDYPAVNKTAMASINIQTGATNPTVDWTVNNSVTECGQHTLLFDEDVAGNGEVDLWYSPSPYWVSGLGTVAQGTSQEWWFSWGGTGDVGPQLIQAEPLETSGELVTVWTAESQDGNGHITYHATVRNDGSAPVRFQWRGGGR
jgi:hypothetical protein